MGRFVRDTPPGLLQVLQPALYLRIFHFTFRGPELLLGAREGEGPLGPWSRELGYRHSQDPEVAAAGLLGHLGVLQLPTWGWLTRPCLLRGRDVAQLSGESGSSDRGLDVVSGERRGDRQVNLGRVFFLTIFLKVLRESGAREALVCGLSPL